MKIRFASQCDKGLIRKNNQDSILTKRYHHASKEVYVFAVADGMGGLANGEQASKLAIDMIDKSVPIIIRKYCAFIENKREEVESLIKLIFMQINQKIYLSSQQENIQSGTTLTVIYVFKDLVFVGHIGDSRLYRFSNGGLVQLTVDHSWVEDKVRAGELTEHDEEYYTKRHILTRCLGVEDTVKPMVLALTKTKNDIFLLCSDGLHGLVDDIEMEASIIQQRKQIKKGRYEAVVASLFDTVYLRGAHDNVSIICAGDRKINFGRLYHAKTADDDSTTLQLPV